MKDLFKLDGKIALITGSTQGIGNLIAKGLAAHGATVIINSSRPEKVEKAVSEIKAMGYQAYGFPFDVTNVDDVKNSIAKIENECGPIDVLINNAGIQRRAPLLEFSEQDWDSLIDVNQKAVFFMMQSVAEHMVKRKQGKIINIGSMQSELGRETITPYAASKGAVKMLTRGGCVELAKHNIQVNGIAPGYFETELTKPLVENQEFTSWLCNRTPANRWGQPEELIGAAVFLSSKASDFVNGHLLFVDGGMLAAV